MPTVVIRLKPAELENPDLDLRYEIPRRLGEVTDGRVGDEGYDYGDAEDDALYLFFGVPDLELTLEAVIQFVETERVLGNDLSLAATIGTSPSEPEVAEAFELAYPRDATGTMRIPSR